MMNPCDVQHKVNTFGKRSEDMDVLWIILGSILMLVGLVGCVLPFLPGPPLCFIGLWIQQLKDEKPFTSNFLWIWAGLTVAVLVLEYVIPAYGTKKFGGSKYGMWGCIIGMVAGFWMGPLGIIIGPFAGALVGELVYNADSQNALRAALGSFVGFLFGTVLKLSACGVMTYYFVKSIFVSP
jgi:uncharacterized protein